MKFVVILAFSFFNYYLMGSTIQLRHRKT